MTILATYSGAYGLAQRSSLPDVPRAAETVCQWLADLAAWAVVSGVLNPETADAPQRIRQAWLTSLTKTLAHIRGEEHAS